MQSQNKRNSHFMIAKEVFIGHILGQIQDQYELNQNCLGQGGFGKVFEGRKKKNLHQHHSQDNLGTSFSSFQTSSRQGSDQQNSSQLRAIKQISYKRLQDKQLMKNQMEILSYLDHPLVVKLYETFQHKKNLYLVIDLLKGGDLFTVINQSTRFSELQARLIFQQLIKALNYLHSQHICHRDLKLENILFLNKDDFNIKLVDFGLAFCWDENMRKQLKQRGQHKKMTGTPDYVAPQMLAQSYDQRCDIWSAGVILYMLLSGQPPFQGQTEKEIIQKIKSMDYTFQISEFQDISENAKDLIRKILRPENQRISLQQILQHPWMSENCCTENDINEINSIPSFRSSKNIRKRHTDLRRKVKTTREFDKSNRKCSQTYSEDTQTDFNCKSSCSDNITFQYGPQQLTVAKLQHYAKLSKLQKLQSIYSVSKLSQTLTKIYGEEFLFMDKDNDGTISLEDFQSYLHQVEDFYQKQKLESYFKEIALSQRGYISYTEYLACVLAYQSQIKQLQTGQFLEFDQRFSQNGKVSLLSQDTMTFEPIDIFDDSYNYDLFCHLDKNNDGLISKSDFVHLFEENGIEQENDSFIKELTVKLHDISKSEHVLTQPKQSKVYWFEDPRKYKQRLSRTYKGESDGGTCIDFKEFKHLMKRQQSQECQK